MAEQNEQKIQHVKHKRYMLVRHGRMKQLDVFEHSETDIPRQPTQVVVKTDKGLELGELVGYVGCYKGGRLKWDPEQLCDYYRVSDMDIPCDPVGKFIRLATHDDISEAHHFQLNSRQEVLRCQVFANQLELKMKVVEAEHILGGERIIFFFTAEGRIDFRELVRQLSHEFQTRIEMRQIGARDEARLLGDLESCGQECCCKRFLRYLKPVNMRMAKLQKANLSDANLHEAKLIGTNLTEAQLNRANLQKAQLIGANLEKAQLILTNLEGALLLDTNLENADLYMTNFNNTNITGIKWNKKVRTGSCRGIRIDTAYGSPGFKSWAQDEAWLCEFLETRTKWWEKGLARLWRETSDYGRSMFRWSVVSALLAVIFGLIYFHMNLWFYNSFSVPNLPKWPEPEGIFTMIYYSVVTFTTLGFGDVVPNNSIAAALVMVEVIMGYIMLGGLISILANKLAKRS